MVIYNNSLIKEYCTSFGGKWQKSQSNTLLNSPNNDKYPNILENLTKFSKSYLLTVSEILDTKKKLRIFIGQDTPPPLPPGLLCTLLQYMITLVPDLCGNFSLKHCHYTTVTCTLDTQRYFLLLHTNPGFDQSTGLDAI